ncbi:MAG TPA: hypothetical protein VHH90_06820 [Polyangia bacterium]|nr:hypothetical protein [Polyangia bacterium]
MILLLVAGSGCKSGVTSPSDCTIAGGKCLAAGSSCPKRGAEACNPDQDPPGAFCCLPCPNGDGSSGAACR